MDSKHSSEKALVTSSSLGSISSSSSSSLLSLGTPSYPIASSPTIPPPSLTSCVSFAQPINSCLPPLAAVPSQVLVHALEFESFLESEKDYVDSLRQILVNYKYPLMKV